VSTGGADEEISLDLVEVGDRLRVRPGKKCRSTDGWWKAEAPWMNPW